MTPAREASDVSHNYRYQQSAFSHQGLFGNQTPAAIFFCRGHYQHSAMWSMCGERQIYSLVSL